MIRFRWKIFEFILSRSSEMKEPFPGKQLEISEINTLFSYSIMLHFQTTVIFKLESVNAPFLRNLKQNLP